MTCPKDSPPPAQQVSRPSQFTQPFLRGADPQLETHPSIPAGQRTAKASNILSVSPAGTSERENVPDDKRVGQRSNPIVVDDVTSPVENRMLPRCKHGVPRAVITPPWGQHTLTAPRLPSHAKIPNTKPSTRKYVHDLSSLMEQYTWLSNPPSRVAQTTEQRLRTVSGPGTSARGYDATLDLEAGNITTQIPPERYLHAASRPAEYSSPYSLPLGQDHVPKDGHNGKNRQTPPNPCPSSESVSAPSSKARHGHATDTVPAPDNGTPHKTSDPSIMDPPGQIATPNDNIPDIVVSPPVENTSSAPNQTWPGPSDKSQPDIIPNPPMTATPEGTSRSVRTLDDNIRDTVSGRSTAKGAGTVSKGTPALEQDNIASDIDPNTNAVVNWIISHSLKPVPDGVPDADTNETKITRGDDLSGVYYSGSLLGLTDH